MRKPDQWPVLPHEIALESFFCVMAARLVGAVGVSTPITLWYLAWPLLLAAVIGYCRRSDSPWRWRVRLAMGPLIMNAAYFSLGIAVPMLHPGKEDALLQHWDDLLAGGNVSLRLHAIESRWLTELLSICYLTFFPMLGLSWLHYFRREVPVLRRFITGVFTIYGVGFFGYMLLPALGPYLDPVLAPQFKEPLVGGWFTRLNAHLVLTGSNKVDVFPSLHCGISAFMLFFDRSHARARFKLFVLPTVGLWIATLYLRYHYLVDVLAGFLLAALALIMVGSLRTKKPSQ